VAALSITATSLWALQRQDDAEAIRLWGTIEARDVEVGSLVGGRVAAVHASEGDAVEPGASLVTLETDLLDAQIEEQRGRLAAASARLEQCVRGPRHEDLASARLEWQNAERDRARVQELLAGGVATEQQYDAAQTRAALAREALRELENGTRGEEISAARAELAREEGRLAYLEREREETAVVAPAAGVIQTLDLRPGDLVSAGAPVARLIQPDDQWVRAYVPEPLLGHVRVGQEATITVDTWRDRRFTGRVVEIRTRAEYTPRNVQTASQRGDQVFGVKVALDPAAELKPGMAATVALRRDAAAKGS
jgi:multidrug resistance efflux pump